MSDEHSIVCREAVVTLLQEKRGVVNSLKISGSMGDSVSQYTTVCSAMLMQSLLLLYEANVISWC